MEPDVDLSSYAQDENGLFLVMDFHKGELLHLTREEIEQWRRDYL